jgi:hypothetical protein
VPTHNECDNIHPAFDAMCGALRTIDLPDRCEDLQPIAIMLQPVRPARSSWRLPGDGWIARMDDSGGIDAHATTYRRYRTKEMVTTVGNRLGSLAAFYETSPAA